MAQDDENLFGCSSVVGVGYLALYILAIVYYAQIVVPYDGTGTNTYEFILSWLYKMGIYSIVNLSLVVVFIIIACASMCAQTITPITVYMIISLLVNFGVMSWLLSEGVNVNNTVGPDCHSPNNISILFTSECLLYGNQFSVLFVFFCVMYSFTALTMTLLLCVGLCGLCGICNQPF